MPSPESLVLQQVVCIRASEGSDLWPWPQCFSASTQDAPSNADGRTEDRIFNLTRPREESCLPPQIVESHWLRHLQRHVDVVGAKTTVLGLLGTLHCTCPVDICSEARPPLPEPVEMSSPAKKSVHSRYCQAKFRRKPARQLVWSEPGAPSSASEETRPVPNPESSEEPESKP